MINGLLQVEDRVAALHAAAALPCLDPYARHIRLHFAMAVGAHPAARPFLSRLGQFIGHDMPVEERMHWPHMRQSNSRPLARRSTNFTGASARL
jgi:hypothetical protein